MAQSAPGTPPCDAPMKVAMLTASGPGVDSDTCLLYTSEVEQMERSVLHLPCKVADEAAAEEDEEVVHIVVDVLFNSCLLYTSRCV